MSGNLEFLPDKSKISPDNVFCPAAMSTRVSLGRFPSENCQANPPSPEEIFGQANPPEPEKIARYLVLNAQKRQKIGGGAKN